MPDTERIREFNEFREYMNDIILSEAPLEIKRLFALDSEVYRDGALTGRIKELIALSCSLVMRCDDCVTYHLQKCVELGYSDDEIWEALAIGQIIGGTVVMPHLRRAVATLKALTAGGAKEW